MKIFLKIELIIMKVRMILFHKKELKILKKKMNGLLKFVLTMVAKKSSQKIKIHYVILILVFGILVIQEYQLKDLLKN